MDIPGIDQLLKKLLLNFKIYDVYLKTWTKYLKNSSGGVKSSALNVSKNKYPHRCFSRSSFMFWEKLGKEYHRLAASFKDQIIEFTKKFSQIYFLWSKFFWQGRMNIYLRKNYILFVTQTFLSKNIFLKWDIYFNISVKKIIIIKLFSRTRTFFSTNVVYFVKNNYFFKKKLFFNLVLQQMNNHMEAVIRFSANNLRANFWKFGSNHERFPIKIIEKYPWTSSFLSTLHAYKQHPN